MSPLWAASGIALRPLPGWASLWLLFALSTLSLLRQAKINWVDSEVGAVSRFTTFHLREWNCSRVFLALLLLRKLGFSMKPFLLLWPLNTWDVPNILHGIRWTLWLRHRCFLRVSPKPSSFVCTPTLAQVLPLGFTKALFLRLHLAIWRPCFNLEPWSLFLRLCFVSVPVVFVWLVRNLVLVAFCTFLHNLSMLNILLVVADTASLTPCSADWRALRPG